VPTPNNPFDQTNLAGKRNPAVPAFVPATPRGSARQDDTLRLETKHRPKETLEVPPMAAISWKNPITGNWSATADWSSNTIPGLGDAVTIAATGAAYTVTVSAPESAASLLLDSATATLTISSTLALSTGLYFNAGTLNVTGPGAALNTGTANLGIGFGGTSSAKLNATLNVSNGGTLVTGGTYDILAFPDSTVNVTVTGTGSKWTAANSIIIAQGYADGPTHSTNEPALGAANPTQATLTISHHATVSAGNNVDVGQFAGANGTLSILSGGSLVENPGTNLTIIGNQVGATGTAIVDGTGGASTWSVNGRLFVGNSGTGTLTIRNGGTVTANGDGSASNNGVEVGVNAGSNGKIIITGPGSLLNVDGRIGAGGAGTGEIDVLNGATLESTYQTSDHSTVWVDGLPGGTGIIRVAGPGSLLNTNDGKLAVGDPGAGGSSGSGTLAISGGATVLAGTKFPLFQPGLSVADGGGAGTTTPATGLVTVDGIGTTLTVTGKGDIGYTGTGTLIVTHSAKATIGQVLTGGSIDGGVLIGDLAGSTGSVTLDSRGKLTSYGHVIVGRNGNGTLLVEGASVLTVVLSAADEAASQYGIGIGTLPGGTGVATVTGAVTGAITNWSIVVGEAGSGTLNIDNGGYVSAGNSVYVGVSGGGGTGNGTLSVYGFGSLLRVGTNLQIGSAGSAVPPPPPVPLAGADGLSAGTGTVDATQGGTIQVGNTLSLAGNATVSVDGNSSIEVGGTGHAAGGQLVVDAAGVVSGFGTINTAVTNTGLVDATGGTLIINGNVTGTGTVAVENGATLQAGNVSGNTVDVKSGGTATGLILGQGATEDVSGIDQSSVVGNGAAEFILAGGTVNDGRVNFGGTLTVENGGTANGLTIAGGTAVIDGTVASPPGVTFTGAFGNLVLNDLPFAAVIHGFGFFDGIDLTGIAYNHHETVSFAAGTLTVANGSQTANLTLAGSYTSSDFTLARDYTGGTLVKFA
jgi:T5SS/PEP-CTERM-associated repeat protein